MTLAEQLEHIPHDALVALVQAIYGTSTAVDDIIERHLVVTQALAIPEAVPEVTKSIRRQFQQLMNDGGFISYRDSYDFSCRLDSLLVDIGTLVAEADPLQALTLLQEFLATGEYAINQSDDSDGNIGMVYRDAIDQWLRLAAQVRQEHPEARDWQATVKAYFDNNDYGLHDNVITHSRGLLTPDELSQLAWQFEHGARAALKNAKESDYNFEAAHACIGLKSVAEALDDMALYEKSVLLTSPEPNTLQLADIIAFALDLEAFERADYWLEQPQWTEDPSRQQEWRNEWLKAQGHIAELKANLRSAFDQNPNPTTLDLAWSLANHDEKEDLKQVVLHLHQHAAGNRSNSIHLVTMLLTVGQPFEAEQQLVRQFDHYEGLPYHLLLRWVDNFEDEQHPMATIVLYRLLLNDILECGMTKAYHHGARYFHRLRELDQQIDNYRPLVNARDYIRQLQDRHWRKRSFWAKADYPNKPV